jgi:hypothetical protein
MKTAVVRALGRFASVLVTGVASAQSTQAVEWKVSEGGNGHWYQIRNVGPCNWFAARDLGVSLGGHLGTITSQAEQDYVAGLIRLAPDYGEPTSGRRWGPWLGGYQDHQASDYSEPNGGWRWVTGELWQYHQLAAGNLCVEDNATEEVLFWCGDYGRCQVWNDLPASGCNGNPPEYVVLEWEADCNSDGIVDYGQILRGELADLNANNIPDACEVSVSGVTPPSVPSQGGSTITIRGTNFQGTPSVKIGGVPATNVVTVSPISLTATSPALLPGMVSVTVNGFTLQEALYIRPQCGSDLDQDGEVTAADIAIVLLDFGPCYVTATSTQAEDSRPFMLREEAAPAVLQSR